MATAKIFHIVIVHITIMTEFLCAGDMLRMCYFNALARYRNEMSRFDTFDIDFSLCTHYIYSYALIGNTMGVYLEPQDTVTELGDNGAYRDFTTRGVNSTHRSRRLLSIGGPNATAKSRMDDLMSSQDIPFFAFNMIPFLRKHHFSGLDIDWQFPVTADMQSALVVLIRFLREAIDRDTYGEKLLLTVKCPVLPVGHPYDVPALSQFADYVILAAYNIPPPNESLTSFGSPLYGQEITVNSTVHEWLRQGLSVNKTVIGISAVGRFVKLINELDYYPNSPKEDTTMSGPLYGIPGGLAYPEVCDMKTMQLSQYDPIARMNIVSRDKLWVSYEDKDSIHAKIVWMMSLNVAGIMFANIDEDDFNGSHCDDGKYPLLNYIKAQLPAPTTVLSTTTRKQTPRRQQTTLTTVRSLETSSSTGPTSTQTTLQSTDPTTVHEVTNQKVYKKSFHNFYLILLTIFLFCLIVLLIAGMYVFK